MSKIKQEIIDFARKQLDLDKTIGITDVKVSYSEDLITIAASVAMDINCDESIQQEIKKPKELKKRKNDIAGGKYGLDREYTTSNEDIDIIRRHLARWKRLNKLTDNQALALKALPRGIKILSDEQKQQILNIFNDIRRSIKKEKTK